MRHYIIDVDEVKEPYRLRASSFLKEYLENLILSEQPYVVRSLVLERPDRETKHLLQACRYFTFVLEGRIPPEDVQFGDEFYEKYWRLSDLVEEMNVSGFLNHLDDPLPSDVQDAPWDMIPIKRHYIWDLYERWDYKDRGDILLKDYLENLILSEQPYVVRNLVLKNPDKETENLLQLCKFFTSVLNGKKPTEDVRFSKEFYEKYWRLSDLVDEVNAGL